MMKVLFSICIGVLFSFAICLPGAVAQEKVPKVINGGVLNGKAVSLPKPEYPVLARDARIGGVVGVNVTIDESGIVISAEADLNDQRERRAEDGTKLEPIPVDPTLREAAENAALQARFLPTFLGGQPVKIKGKILYNFIVDNSDQGPRVGEINGPLLNGKATYLAKPTYPAAARAVHAEGMVTVKITIDEDGSVIAAEAINGHPLLRAASEAAAREAKFLPTLLSGQPVKVSGILTYNFVLPKKEGQ